MDEKVKETLMNAVIGDKFKNVKNLFNKYKFEPDDSFFDYELLKAALIRNDQRIVKFLLKIGCRVVNPNKSDEEETLLHLLPIENDLILSSYDRIISKLIDKGASFYDKNLNGETAVQAAFKKGYFKTVKVLLNNCKSNFKPENKDDVLHFHIACVINEYGIAEDYLKSGIDPNSPLSLDSKEYAGLNPIHFAVKKDHLELFTRLLKYNGDLSIKNDKGLTPLHMIYYSKCPNNGKSNGIGFQWNTWIHKAFKIGKETKFINSEDKHKLSHFHLCCTINKPDFVQTFIDNGVNVNNSVSLKCPLNPGFTPLLFAVSNNCKEVVKLLLKNGADPNKSDKKGKTPLHLACKMSGKLGTETVKMLLEYKASSIISDKKGCTPLHEAFYHVTDEDLQIFNPLISKMQWGIDNYTDEQGLSLFHIVCTTNHVNQVIKFLNSGVDIDSCVSSEFYSGFTALHFAVMYNQKDVVKVLLGRKAKVNKKANKSGITPLHLACEFNQMKFDGVESNGLRFRYNTVNSDLTSSRTNQLEIINLLLSHGSDINAKDFVGITPLLHACMIDNTYFIRYCNQEWNEISDRSEEIIKIVILNKSNLSQLNTYDQLSNEISNRLEEIIKILISNKANVNTRSHGRLSILHIIGRYNSLKISEKLMKILVTSGADVNAVIVNGLTPLHVAAANSNKMLVRLLLKHNANPNVKYNSSSIPLHIVVPRIVNMFKYDKRVRESDNDIFCALIENGSDVNIRDQDGGIMLHAAMRNFKSTVIQKLLYYGADINIEDSSGKSSVSEVLEWCKKEEWMISLYGEMFQIIFIDVQKLFALGLPVSEKVQNSCEQLYPCYKRQHETVEGLTDLDNIFNNCIHELDKMKGIKIDYYTSLYDILLKDPHELAKHINNSCLIKMLKLQNVDIGFPLYGYLLRLQFKRGLIRSEVLQSAEAALVKALNINLPDLCCDLILQHLRNEEIVHLKEATTVKRNLKRKLCDDNSNQTEITSKLQKKETGPRVEIKADKGE